MNPLLLRGGYPPVAVRPQDHAAYVATSQRHQAGGGSDAFDRLLLERLATALDDTLDMLDQAEPAP
jgi:predicted alpha/beta superfamily hydrolase